MRTIPTQPYNYFKHFLLFFSFFLFYNNIIIPSLNSLFEAFELYTFAAFAVSVPFIFKLEATEVSSSAKSSFDKEADDASISEVFFSTNKHSLTIWAVIYANIK